MQAELDTLATARAVEILGVNGAGEESGNALVCEGRSLPWLQDTPEARVWESWRVEYRDVVVLDASNRVVAVYNLTSRDLGQPAYYAELRDLLVAAAR